MSEDEGGLLIEIENDGVDDSESSGESSEGASAGGGVVRRVIGGRRRRRRVPGGRPHTVLVRLSEQEFEQVAVRAAAARVGVAHYVALRAVNPPGAGQMDVTQLRAWAVEVMALRRELVRVGTNLNQVTRLLNGTGEIGRHAEQALFEVSAVVGRLTPAVVWLRRVTGYDGPGDGL